MGASMMAAAGTGAVTDWCSWCGCGDAAAEVLLGVTATSSRGPPFDGWRKRSCSLQLVRMGRRLGPLTGLHAPVEAS